MFIFSHPIKAHLALLTLMRAYLLVDTVDVCIVDTVFLWSLRRLFLPNLINTHIFYDSPYQSASRTPHTDAAVSSYEHC